jgi:hypothetical protein
MPHKQEHVINELSKSTLPVFLGLLGGEPTLHQRYFKFLDQVVDRVITHDKSRLYITTNGHKPPEFFNGHRDTDGKIFMLWSLHPEFTDFDNFYDNIVLMHNKGYKTKINLMLHPNPRYWDTTKRWYDKLNTLDYALIHPHFVYGGFSEDVVYPDEFYEYFSFLEDQREKEFVFSTEDKEFILSDYEIFKNGYNTFKGWNCWHNNFEITNDCQISDQCFVNMSQDIPENFFRDITEIKPRICPHDYCSCDGLMKIYKEKVDD